MSHDHRGNQRKYGAENDIRMFCDEIEPKFLRHLFSSAAIDDDAIDVIHMEDTVYNVIVTVNTKLCCFFRRWYRDRNDRHTALSEAEELHFVMEYKCLWESVVV